MATSPRPMNAHTRKKQPEHVRRALLDHVARIALEHGMAGVTVQAVAAAAGVTKGGLFHHFPSKKALIEGMFADLLERLDAEIDATIARDPEPRGSFTRAYVDSVFVSRAFGLDSSWMALSVAMIVDPGLRDLWSAWMTARLRRHRDTDADPTLEIVRLAADGAWLKASTWDGGEPLDGPAIHERLLALSRI